jgi:hypothetical protein
MNIPELSEVTTQADFGQNTGVLLSIFSRDICLGKKLQETKSLYTLTSRKKGTE